MNRDERIESNDFYQSIRGVLIDARKKSYRVINTIMVKAYWEVGRLIVEEEQNGKARAEYGKSLLKELSKKLTKEFGKGFNETGLRRMRQFFVVYQKQATLPHELSWSHYCELIKIKEDSVRLFYEKHAIRSCINVARSANTVVHSIKYLRVKNG